MSSRSFGFLARRGGTSLSPAHVAGRAAEIIKEQVESVVAAAEAKGAEAQREAVLEAGKVRGEAVTAASRTLERMEQVESRLSRLTSEITLEADRLRASLGRSAARADAEVRELEASTSAATPVEARASTVPTRETDRERADRVSHWSAPEPQPVDAEVVSDPMPASDEQRNVVGAPRSQPASPLTVSAVPPRSYRPMPRPTVKPQPTAVVTQPAPEPTLAAEPVSEPTPVPEVAPVEEPAPQAKQAPEQDVAATKPDLRAPVETPAPAESGVPVADEASVAPRPEVDTPSEQSTDTSEASNATSEPSTGAGAGANTLGTIETPEPEPTTAAAEEADPRVELGSRTDLELAAAYNESKEELWRAELQGLVSEVEEWSSVVEALVAEAARRPSFGLGRQEGEGWGFLGRRRRERELQALLDARQAALGSVSASPASSP